MPSPDQQSALKSSVTLVPVFKASDTQALITNGVENAPEDSFHGQYTAQPDSQGSSTTVIIEPPFNPGLLKMLVASNNTLLQCIDVMKVNVGGTGHTIEKVEGEDFKDNEPNRRILIDFFDEPYPGKSMISLRKSLEEDLESTGNAYMEIIRNIGGDTVMLNSLDSCEMRLVALDAPVFVDKVVTRGGKEVTLKIRARERRFVQLINGRRVYFKEFGSQRDLDRDTGQWATPGMKLSIAKRASEIYHFRLSKSARTAYGQPDWINQLPAVLGSRKAEEFNLSFFDNGGLPPVLILVQGGYLASGVKEDLQAHLNGTGNKTRAAIVEAMSASGSLDSAGSVKVTVERFGSERQQDSMFQKYDESCEAHVRGAFRVPPIFFGRASDYNFATALTGYMTADAQVFRPRRIEFDEVMYLVSKDLGVRDYLYQSKSMTLTNIDNQIKVVDMALTAAIVDKEEALGELNKISGLNLTYKDTAPAPAAPPTGLETVPGANTQPVLPESPAESSSGLSSLPRSKTKAGSTAMPANQIPPILRVVKSDGVEVPEAEVPSYIMNLSDRWFQVLQSKPMTLTEKSEILSSVNQLTGYAQKQFNDLLALRSLNSVEGQVEDFAELCSCANSLTFPQ